jgi:hypothetical protein
MDCDSATVKEKRSEAPSISKLAVEGVVMDIGFSRKFDFVLLDVTFVSCGAFMSGSVLKQIVL